MRKTRALVLLSVIGAVFSACSSSNPSTPAGGTTATGGGAASGSGVTAASGSGVTAASGSGGSLSGTGVTTSAGGAAQSSGETTTVNGVGGSGGSMCGAMCAGQCTDLESSADNCGSCGHSCGNAACVGGHCANEVLKVATSDDTSCVLMGDGNVWCWGETKGFILGVETMPESDVPVQVAGVSDAVALFGGPNSRGFCIVKKDGSASCWSENDGPAPIVFPNGVKIAKIFLSHPGSESCALTTGGDVYCWGLEQALLGNCGDLMNIVAPPTKVDAFDGDVIDFSLNEGGGDPVACALKSDGSVWCWGSNSNGQTGQPPSMDCKFANTTLIPSQVSDENAMPLSGMTAIGAGADFACALKNDGSVWCWGSNDKGILGRGTQDVNDAAHPGAAPAIGVGGIVTLSVGDSTVFASDAAGNVTMWGSNAYAESGLGNNDDPGGCNQGSCVSTPTAAPLLSGATQIWLDNLSGLALMGDGSVVAWGSNAEGECGHAPGTDGDVNLWGVAEVTPIPSPIAGLP